VVSGAGEMPAQASSPALGVRFLMTPPPWRAFTSLAAECATQRRRASSPSVGDCPYALSVSTVERVAQSGSSCLYVYQAAPGQPEMGRRVVVPPPRVNPFFWTRRPSPRGSDNGHCVNLAALVFAGVAWDGARCGSINAASGIRTATVCRVCGGFAWWVALGSGKLRKSPLDLACPFAIDAHTDQRAGVIVQGPIALVLPDSHTISPLEVRVGVAPLPGGPLLAVQFF
jgi:hypothetical protein